MSRKPKKRKSRRKPGRPEFKVTPAVLKVAEDVAKRGATMREIAARLGISPTTLYEKKAEYSELLDAIERGVAASIEAVRNDLFENATSPALGKDGPVGPPAGSVEAQKFFLQSRAGDKVNNTVELKGDEGAPLAVRIILPSNDRKV
jgi:AcrR family transcriptional regulator